MKLVLIAIACIAGALGGEAARAQTTAPVVRQKIVWGAKSGDLQLGVRPKANAQSYFRGEDAPFDLVLRNTGKAALKLEYFAPLFPVPTITDDNGKPLPGVLKSPPPLGYPLSLATLALAPGQARQISETRLDIGLPPTPTLFWTLDAAPGQYRVSFGVSLRFRQDAAKEKRSPLALQSGFVPLEIAPPRAVEFAAELPAGAQIKRELPTWGRETDGLQLGISLDYLTRPYRIGEEAAFTLSVRNNRATPVKLSFFKPDWVVVPTVTKGNGEALTLSQQAFLFGPAMNIPVSSVTKEIAPGQTVEVASARLTIGPPAKDESNPALDVAPGRYNVSYDYAFQADMTAAKTAAAIWVGTLKSGAITLQVAPALPAK